MLRTLSGNTHTVVTAFAIASAGMISDNLPVLSRVTFRALSVKEIADYVATGQPLDKAGSYGIQDAGAGFITNVEGARAFQTYLLSPSTQAAIRTIHYPGAASVSWVPGGRHNRSAMLPRTG